MAAGAYSSIFIATPLLVHMKSKRDRASWTQERGQGPRRHDADRYASVPAFTEDMPIGADPDEAPRRRVERR